MMDRRKLLRVPLVPEAEAAADLEIQNHIAEATDRLIDEGWSPEDARSEAERRFGSVRRVRGTMVRETRAIERRASLLDFLLSIPADVRYAWRSLARNPLFAVIVVATLGVGMGAAATAFTIVDALLLRPLPYLQPDRLVDVNVIFPGDTLSSAPIVTLSRMRSLQAGHPALSQFAAFHQRSFTMTDEAGAEQIGALVASADLDEMLGMRAHLGRGFDTADVRSGSHRVMLSYEFWKKRGADKKIVGSTLRMDDTPYDVVGVLPRNFKFPVYGEPKDVWVAMTPELIANESYVNGTGRLADGITFDAANARFAAMAAAPGAEGMDAFDLRLTPMGRWRGNPELVRGVWLIAGAIVLMLLVAMVNAMNLILFRGADRTRELAVRLALGVSRLQLARHIVVENLVIALLSGCAAVAVTIAGVAAVNRRLPNDFAFSSAYAFELTPRVLVFAFLLACATGMVLGLLPLFRAMRLRFVAGQLTTARGATRADTHVARALVIAEVALAVALLTGASLLAASFSRLTSVDPGLDTDRLVLLSLSLPDRYSSAEMRASFFNRFEQALEAEPDIEGATVSMGAPPSVSFSFGVALQAEGAKPLPEDKEMLLPFISATPDFVKTAGVRMLAGRELTPADVGTTNVLIDDNLAEALFGGEITGRRFRTDADGDWFTAVGIYKHMHAMGYDDRSTPYGYIRARNPAKAGNYLSVIVRPRGDPDAAVPVVKQALHRLDPAVAPSKLLTSREAFSETVDKPRFLARVMGGVSASALLLAAIGIYGVLSYSVARRRREMGIRMAIGAAPMRLGWLFLREGLMLSAIGVALGLMIGFWIVQYSKVLLYGLQPGDPMSYAVATVIVLIVAAIASVIPARAASRMPPASVLRTE